MQDDLDMDVEEISRPFVDFLILADYVESINSKLYIMGGAWEDYTLQDPKRPTRFGVAVAVMVPWATTNERHTLQLRIEDADGQAVLQPLGIDFQMGRPPNLPPGSEQRMVLAFNGDFPINQPGQYRVIAAIDGQDSEWTTFRVRLAPPPQPAGR